MPLLEIHTVPGGEHADLVGCASSFLPVLVPVHQVYLSVSYFI
jgi:hypothetical protein